MAAIITGVVVGVVVALAGAVTNYFLTKWRDQRQWQREDEVRKQESKQRAYEEFTKLTFLPPGFHETSEQTSEHYEKLASALTGVELYATPAVREAAQHAYNLELKRDEHDEESEEYKRLDEDLEKAQRKFRSAARKELVPHRVEPRP